MKVFVQGDSRLVSNLIKYFGDEIVTSGEFNVLIYVVELNENTKIFKENIQMVSQFAHLALKNKAKFFFVTDSDKYGELYKPAIETREIGAKILKLYNKYYHLQCASIHIHDVYGIGNNFLDDAINSLNNNKPVVIKHKYYELIHVTDVCRALKLLSNHPNIQFSPVIEITGNPISGLDVIKLIRNNLVEGKDYIYEYVNEQYISKPNIDTILVEFKPVYTINEYLS